jgi:hypothetical protein
MAESVILISFINAGGLSDIGPYSASATTSRLLSANPELNEQDQKMLAKNRG